MSEETREHPPEPVLARGARFEGLLVLPRDACVEGSLRGEVLAAGELWVGEQASLDAHIEADVVVVAGSVKGVIHARRRIELRPTARVAAELHAPRLALAEGSVLQGDCQAGDDPREAPSSS